MPLDENRAHTWKADQQGMKPAVSSDLTTPRGMEEKGREVAGFAYPPQPLPHLQPEPHPQLPPQHDILLFLCSPRTTPRKLKKARDKHTQDSGTR